MPPVSPEGPQERDPVYFHPQPEQRETTSDVRNPHVANPRSAHVPHDQRRGIHHSGAAVGQIEPTAVEELSSLSRSKTVDLPSLSADPLRSTQNDGKMKNRLKISLRKLACRLHSARAAFEGTKCTIKHLITDNHGRENLLCDLRGIYNVGHQSDI